MRRDEGVTMVELLMALAVSMVIIPTVTGALVFGWRTTDSTVDSLSQSRNRQISSSQFAGDVASADALDTNGSTTTCMQTGDTLLIRMTRDETPATGSSVSKVVTWVKTSASTIERRLCSGGSSTGGITVTRGVVGTPAVVCKATATGSAVACGSGSFATITITDASGAFALTGQRRTP